MGRHSGDAVVGALGKHTIWAPAGGWKSKASNGATATSYQDITALSFSGTSINRVRALIWMPKSWNEGVLSFKVAGTIDTGGATGATVLFKMAAKAYSEGDTMWTTSDLSTGAQQAQAEWTADDKFLPTAESPSITPDGSPAEEDLVLVELWRDPTDGIDDTTAAFLMFGAKIYLSFNSPEDA